MGGKKKRSLGARDMVDLGSEKLTDWGWGEKEGGLVLDEGRK